MRTILQKNQQVFFFILAGVLSACIEIGSFKGLSLAFTRLFSWEKNLGGIHYPLSNIFSTALGIISNYYFSIWFVFSRGKHSKRREFTYFMGISMASTVMSLALFQIFYSLFFEGRVLDISIFVFSGEILSKFFSIGAVAVLNYFVKKKFIFN